MSIEGLLSNDATKQACKQTGCQQFDRREFIKKVSAVMALNHVDGTDSIAAGNQENEYIRQLLENLKKQGWLITEYNPSNEGKGISAPCIVAPEGYSCRSIVIGQGAHIPKGSDVSEIEFYYYMPADFGDRGHLASKPVVVAGGETLDHESEVVYSTPETSMGYRNKLMWISIKNPPSGTTINTQVLHWIMAPVTSDVTQSAKRRFEQINPRAYYAVQGAVNASAIYHPPTNSPCGFKAQYCQNLAGNYARYVAGFVNNAGGKETGNETKHAWVMIMINGRYAFVDPLNATNVPWGQLGGYVPCAFSSTTVIPEKNAKFANKSGGMSYRGGRKTRLEYLGLQFLKDRKEIAFSDDSIFNPPQEVIDYYNCRV
ncbi:hypothetical protein KKG16_03580, partial [Patescibacteria group bacterium]|nr:hypothetical protein [Patescibacteria group bacterium]